MNKTKRILLAVIALLVSASCDEDSYKNDIQWPPSPHVPKICAAWVEKNSSGVFQLYVKMETGDNLGTWTQLGTTSLNINAANTATEPSIAQDGYGYPYVAWTENGEVYIKHWNAASGSWELVGDVTTPFKAKLTSISAGVTLGEYNPSISVGVDGTLAIAYIDNTSGTSLLLVKKWTGTAWEDVGTLPLNIDPLRNAGKPSLAVYSASLMYVAWVENNGTYTEVYVKKWDGTSWTRLPESGSLNTITDYTFDPMIKVNAVGIPYVVFRQRNGGGDEDYSVLVFQWNGSSGAWEQLDNRLPGDYSQYRNPSIALNLYGKLYTLHTSSSYNNLYAHTWDSDSSIWQGLGVGQLNSKPVYNTSLAVSLPSTSSDTGTLFALWSESDGAVWSITAKYWDGSTWQGGENLNFDTSKPAEGAAVSAR